MGKSLFATLLFTAAISMYSCNPDPDLEPNTQQVWLYTGSDTFAYGKILNRLLETPIFEAHGIFVAGKLTGDLLDYLDSPYTLKRFWCSADFRDKENSIPAGDVLLNGELLSMGWPRGRDNSYYYLNKDSSGLWHENASNTWTITGTSVIPQISYSLSGEYPEYTGILPNSIALDQDLMIPFNSSEVQNADFAFVTITGRDGGYKRSQVVSANGGSAIIPAAEINRIFNDNDGSAQGKIGFQLYKQDIQSFGGKSFVFIKLREAWRDVVFN